MLTVLTGRISRCKECTRIIALISAVQLLSSGTHVQNNPEFWAKLLHITSIGVLCQYILT